VNGFKKQFIFIFFINFRFFEVETILLLVNIHRVHILTIISLNLTIYILLIKYKNILFKWIF